MQDGNVTEWLSRLRAGDEGALEHLLPLVYDELKRIARAQLRREDTGHTLSPTALVHEAYFRLADREHLAPEDRRHFLSIAAQAMRRVLIEHARARRRDKRGGGARPVPLDEAAEWLTDSAADELVSLDEALERLTAVNQRASDVVQYRFFGGLSLDETADLMGISKKTVQRDWLLARAWLRKEMDRDVLDTVPGSGD
ncbi:MAG: sigma-70 family RNA polymerase sigma factor [Gemmatimonadaceae bacterium]